MAKKKKIDKEEIKLPEAPATPQPITETLVKNYMPYAMSVIVSRAIPEIDGFKPSHRKLLYTMYKMGLLNGGRTKSANIVGQTMRLNPHGDASIYETMVRLTRDHEALLHPFVDSKGSFGKQYSRDMAYAASRYTEAKLESFCQELFSGIDKDAVDFVPNYDNTTTEPSLLPTTFPNILVSPNLGIAVGMACSICSFNLIEICDGAIAMLKNPKTTIDRILDIVKAPDFPGGAQIIYDREVMRSIYETGVGSIKMRAKYEYIKKTHSIDILEIPYSSSIEAIMKKTTEMIKTGKLKEVVDVRDAIDLKGFKLTLDLKKDANPDVVMQKLFASTELEKNFDCNFNILVKGTPMQLGIREILAEWIKFRCECMSRELRFDLEKKEDKLHLLEGLMKIVVDIDKAIRIIRNTANEADVVPNLAAGFGLTLKQAEYIAEIKLRNINSEYLLNRGKEIKSLTEDIDEIKSILRDEFKLKKVIIDQLGEIKKKYGKPRKTEIVNKEVIVETKKEEIFFENYNCRLIFTKGGYFKKLSTQGMRAADEQKLKEGDFVIYVEDTDNRGDVLFFTDKAQIYRARVSDFDISKPSQMGDYIPSKLGFDDDEHAIACKMIYEIKPDHFMLYIFENGKGLRVKMSSYEAKSRRRKISGAYSSASPLAGAVYLDKDKDVFIRSDAGKAMLIKASKVKDFNTRTSAGTQVMQLPKKGVKIDLVTDRIEDVGPDAAKCRKINVPSMGTSIAQLTFNF